MVATANRLSFMDEEAPPTYTLFPRPEEQSIDAGAGAPIVRAQAPHLVFNPSDPRSQHTRNFYGGDNAPLVPPRRTDVAAGPIPVNPRLPQRLNAGYEQMETALHLTPRMQPSPTQLHQPITTAIFSHAPPGPADGTVSYSTLRDAPTTARVFQGPGTVGRHWQQRHRPDALVSSWPARHGNTAGYPGMPHTTVVAVNCPACRNTGWLGSRTQCSCPMGVAARGQLARPPQSSLLGFLEDMLTPHLSSYSSHAAQQHQHPFSHGGGGGTTPAYAHSIPGLGALCPHCTGRSYFRNAGAQALPAGRELERQYGGPPPPCEVCGNRGRLR
ncbi:hypothetical protein LPJ66_004391 [Kickxella alabastrina]|uniref:Uncharacterized protein n=1 Tax=Kickxella alabastrina TaxID=61397 RepID=A0ACC1IMU1_9FUNG|nr:hypothetical protein LPJ66_004391 [Kickxella alabastrina]